MAERFDRIGERAETTSALAHLKPDGRSALIEEYQRRTEAAFAPETLRNYRKIIASFSDWCASRGYPVEPPVPPQVVAEYVESLGGKLSSNTIETRLWAIAKLHRSNFMASPCRHRLVELAIKSVKRKYGIRTKQAPPLRKEEVFAVLRELGNTAAELRDRALIWTASDSWCRISELIALRVCDLERQDDLSSVLTIRRSKTDQYGAGDYAYLSPKGTDAVLEWIEFAGLEDKDPIFTKSQAGGRRTAINSATVGRMLKKRFGRQDVSSHSFRVGGVHDAFSLGCDLASIMVAGRWRSPEMPARYGRRILVSQSAAAQVAKAFEHLADAYEEETM